MSAGSKSGFDAGPKSGSDYVVVGHVTVDVLSVNGQLQQRPGGSALYSGLQAARLGMRTLLVTRGRPDELHELLEPYAAELCLQVIPSRRTTTLHTEGSGERRRQRISDWAGPIELRSLPEAAIAHIAPVANETPQDAHCSAGFVAITPQGLARSWATPARSWAIPQKGSDVVGTALREGALPVRFDAASLSRQELQWCSALNEAAERSGAVVAITDGAAPTEVRWPEGKATIATLAATGQADDLGAGDVFAAAFFIALHHGAEPADAAAFGNAAAAVRMRGDGANAIGNRSTIETALGSASGG